MVSLAGSFYFSTIIGCLLNFGKSDQNGQKVKATRLTPLTFCRQHVKAYPGFQIAKALVQREDSLIGAV
jgi:hypothetical protein